MPRLRRLIDRGHAEGGFALTELLVYCLLLGIVVTLIGGVMASLLKSSKTIDKTTAASSAAQLAANSLQSGVRNASAIELVSIGAGDQLLMVRTADNADTLSWSCEAWYYSAAGESIRHARWPESDGAIVQPTADPVGWTLLAEQVGASSPAGVFSLSGSILDIRFTVSVEGHEPIEIVSAASSRQQPTTGSPCFGGP